MEFRPSVPLAALSTTVPVRVTVLEKVRLPLLTRRARFPVPPFQANCPPATTVRVPAPLRLPLLFTLRTLALPTAASVELALMLMAPAPETVPPFCSVTVPPDGRVRKALVATSVMAPLLLPLLTTKAPLETVTVPLLLKGALRVTVLDVVLLSWLRLLNCDVGLEGAVMDPAAVNVKVPVARLFKTAPFWSCSVVVPEVVTALALSSVESVLEAFRTVWPVPLMVPPLHAAVFSLRNIGPDAKAAVPALLEIVNTKESALRGAALMTLAKIVPNDKKLVPLCVQFLKDKDPQLRAFAAKALGSLGTAAHAAIPDLIEALKAEGFTNAAQRAAVLGNILTTLEQFGADAGVAVPIIRVLANDADRHVRDSARRALKKLDPVP